MVPASIQYSLRGLQAILSIVVLGLSAYLIDTGLPYSIVTLEIPQCISYTLFTSIWTLLALGYLIFVPIYLSTSPLAHKYAVISVEALTMIFWFAAWIAVAVRWGTGDFLIWARWSQFWDAGLADIGVEVVLWLTFVATMVITGLDTRKSSTKRVNSV